MDLIGFVKNKAKPVERLSKEEYGKLLERSKSSDRRLNTYAEKYSGIQKVISKAKKCGKEDINMTMQYNYGYFFEGDEKTRKICKRHHVSEMSIKIVLSEVIASFEYRHAKNVAASVLSKIVSLSKETVRRALNALNDLKILSIEDDYVFREKSRQVNKGSKYSAVLRTYVKSRRKYKFENSSKKFDVTAVDFATKTLLNLFPLGLVGAVVSNLTVCLVGGAKIDSRITRRTFMAACNMTEFQRKLLARGIELGAFRRLEFFKDKSKEYKGEVFQPLSKECNRLFAKGLARAITDDFEKLKPRMLDCN